MSSHKIISVCVVEGNTLDSNWGNDMQMVTTDKGDFIDNMPGVQFGFPSAHPGFEWATHVGETMDGIKVIENSDYKWLNKPPV